MSGSNSVSDSSSSSNSSIRIASSLCSAGKTSIVSPRTRKVPREKSDLVARVLHPDQVGDRVALAELVAGAHDHPHLGVVLGRADAVDRAHRGDDDDVAPLEHALGRRQAHLLDVLVDRAVLLDEEIALRHVGLGLVVVVVADEVLDRVLREELAELAVELRRQRLVRREDDRRPADLGDHVGHREGLARAGDAEQRLEARGRRGCPRPGRRSPPAGRRPAIGPKQLERRAGIRDEFTLRVSAA